MKSPKTDLLASEFSDWVTDSPRNRGRRIQPITYLGDFLCWKEGLFVCACFLIERLRRSRAAILGGWLLTISGILNAGDCEMKRGGVDRVTLIISGILNAGTVK